MCELQMYQKIWGLNKLEKMGFPCPPYIIIDITGDKPAEVREYVLRKIGEVGIPHVERDRIGVTIRVSTSGDLDKSAKHGGLHVSEEKDVLERVLEKYEQYKPYGKIVVQHTVDARCSGTILKENEFAIIEAILGDAPPLLEGEVSNYEKWVFLLESGRWKKERAYMGYGKKVTILSPEDLKLLEGYMKTLISNTYVEWSMAKNGKLYFYEYCKLKGETH